MLYDAVAYVCSLPHLCVCVPCNVAAVHSVSQMYAMIKCLRLMLPAAHLAYFTDTSSREARTVAEPSPSGKPEALELTQVLTSSCA